MSIEIVLSVIAYTLFGICVYTIAVRYFRENEWLSYEDLFQIAIPFFLIWPLGFLFFLISKFNDSDFSYKILKLINGR